VTPDELPELVVVEVNDDGGSFDEVVEDCDWLDEPESLVEDPPQAASVIASAPVPNTAVIVVVAVALRTARRARSRREIAAGRSDSFMTTDCRRHVGASLTPTVISL
jgi:hypothetical protein